VAYMSVRPSYLKTLCRQALRLDESHQHLTKIDKNACELAWGNDRSDDLSRGGDGRPVEATSTEL
jgi:hypothetical protein